MNLDDLMIYDAVKLRRAYLALTAAHAADADQIVAAGEVLDALRSMAADGTSGAMAFLASVGVTLRGEPSSVHDGASLTRLAGILRALTGASDSATRLVLSAWATPEKGSEAIRPWFADARLLYGDKDDEVPLSRVTVSVRRPYDDGSPPAGDALPMLLAEAERVARERVAALTSATGGMP